MDNKQKQISASTLKLYDGVLNKIKKCGFDIDNIILDKLEEICIENEYAQPTKFMIYKALLWYAKKNNHNTDLIDDIYKIVNKNIKIDRNKYMENKLFENEKDKYVDWEIIQHIYNKIEELHFNNINNEEIMEEYLLLSLYVILPPRRLMDYLYMKKTNIVIKREPDCIIWTNEENTNKYDNNKNYDAEKVKMIKDDCDMEYNYFIVDKEDSYFLFNNYKTFKFYMQQVIEVPKKINIILKKFIEIKKIKDNELIFNYNKPFFVSKINNIFKKYINKKISINIIRHSKITKELSDSKITDKEKYIISQIMAHSLSTQSIYKKIIESDTEDEEKIVEIINENAEMINKDISIISKKKIGRPLKYKTEEERKIASKEYTKKSLLKKNSEDGEDENNKKKAGRPVVYKTQEEKNAAIKEAKKRFMNKNKI